MKQTNQIQSFSFNLANVKIPTESRGPVLFGQKKLFCLISSDDCSKQVNNSAINLIYRRRTQLRKAE